MGSSKSLITNIPNCISSISSFRSSFEADKKEEEIQNAIRNGIDKKDCLAISDIAKEAGQEILNVGFQQDFLFVSSVLEALSEILPE